MHNSIRHIEYWLHDAQYRYIGNREWKTSNHFRPSHYTYRYSAHGRVDHDPSGICIVFDSSAPRACFHIPKNAPGVKQKQKKTRRFIRDPHVKSSRNRLSTLPRTHRRPRFWRNILENSVCDKIVFRNIRDFIVFAKKVAASQSYFGAIVKIFKTLDLSIILSNDNIYINLIRIE